MSSPIRSPCWIGSAGLSKKVVVHVAVIGAGTAVPVQPHVHPASGGPDHPEVKHLRGSWVATSLDPPAHYEAGYWRAYCSPNSEGPTWANVQSPHPPVELASPGRMAPNVTLARVITGHAAGRPIASASPQRSAVDFPRVIRRVETIASTGASCRTSTGIGQLWRANDSVIRTAQRLRARCSPSDTGRCAHCWVSIKHDTLATDALRRASEHPHAPTCAGRPGSIRLMPSIGPGRGQV